MQKFDKEGIKELNNEGQEAIQNILWFGEPKYKLKNYQVNMKTSTGKSNEMDGSVKFIMKTNERKVQEKITTRKLGREKDLVYVMMSKQ